MTQPHLARQLVTDFVRQFDACAAEGLAHLTRTTLGSDYKWRGMYPFGEIHGPGEVIDVVTGELNLAAARKYDLEAWFPGSSCYRELVSCSNCLDYQARRLDTRIAGRAAKNVASEHTHVHMLARTHTHSPVRAPTPPISLSPSLRLLVSL